MHTLERVAPLERQEGQAHEADEHCKEDDDVLPQVLEGRVVHRLG